jgi:hypothetical protein
MDEKFENNNSPIHKNSLAPLYLQELTSRSNHNRYPNLKAKNVIKKLIVKK